MDKSEEIKYLLHSNNIKISWLAKNLDMKTQTLTYLLNNSSHSIDDDLYEQIKSIIDSYQLELQLFEDDPSEDFDLFDEANFSVGVGERIRIFGKRKFGTFTKLAEALEISPQHLQLYISGKREPGTKMLVKFLRIGCDVNWLLGGNERVESYRIIKLENEIKKLRNTIDKISHLVAK